MRLDIKAKFFITFLILAFTSLMTGISIYSLFLPQMPHIQEYRFIKVLLFFVIFIGVATTVIWVGFLFVSVIRPLKKLREAVIKAGSGDLTQNILISKRDELMDLILSTVKLIKQLQDTNVQLKNQRKVLEEKVEELDKAQRQLKITQSEFAHSEKMVSLGRLVTGISHELNNPLSYILSNISTLEKYVLAMLRVVELYHQQRLLLEEEASLQKVESVEQDLDKLKEELDFGFILKDLPRLVAETQEGLQKIKGIIKDLTVFAHTDKGEMSYADINEIIESTVRILWNEIKYKADLVKDYASLPALLCYPQQLSQVFMNILINAVQAIEQHGTITIKTYVKDNSVFIEISDTGCGIPREHLSHIFEPFFTTKSIGKGVGLGLSIVYSIIQRHKGYIEVKSKVGQGTTFIINLPIEPEREMIKNGTN